MADEPGTPVFKPPVNACDAHCHIFGPAQLYPLAANQSYSPPDAPLGALRALHARLGIGRAVIVNATAYGTDHRIALDAIAQSEGRYRGVANLDASVTEREIEMLAQGGFRGCRFSFLEHLGGAPDMSVFDRVLAMVAPFGWHVDLLIDASGLAEHSGLLRRLPLPYVIDHMGRVDASRGVRQEPLEALLRLLRSDDKCWVKLSGADRVSAMCGSLRDAVPVAHEIIDAAPDRVLWGTDWPHPHVKLLPADHELIDLIPLLAPDADRRQRMLVANPERLYGF
jgi:2-pyrone-4,6-dicarboxylate lactonase